MSEAEVTGFSEACLSESGGRRKKLTARRHIQARALGQTKQAGGHLQKAGHDVLRAFILFTLLVIAEAHVCLPHGNKSAIPNPEQ
jgi:hypothetical protein